MPGLRWRGTAGGRRDRLSRGSRAMSFFDDIGNFLGDAGSDILNVGKKVALPLLGGALSLGTGGIGGFLLPTLVNAGLGAGIGALTGNPGGGAALGALSGALGLGGHSGALNSLYGIGGGGATSPIAVNDEGESQVGNNGLVSTQGQQVPNFGTGNPLAQTSGKQASGLSGPLAILAALVQNANRPSTTAPTGVTQNMPWNTTGFLSRTPNMNAPAGGNYYTYGQSSQPQFFNNNQLTFPKFAHGGGVLSQMISGGHFAQGGNTFSTVNGDHLVQGDGAGQQDNISAKLSPGEWVADANFVSALGDGNNEEGSKRLYEMRHQVMQDKGMKHDVPPKLKKSPLEYLQQVS